MEIVDLVTVISIALLGSFSHCIGMCGGIVIAYSAAKFDGGASKSQKFFLHLVYNLGRTTTYVLFGIAFGAFGSVVSLSSKANAFLYFLGGVFMVLAGLNLLGYFKLPKFLEVDVSGNTVYQGLFRSLLKAQTWGSFYALGMLNGLIPCGFVYFFAIKAASTASPLWGAIVMGTFGLSTIPSLLTLGLFVTGLQSFRTSWRNQLYKLAGLSVIIYGVVTIYLAYGFWIDPTSSLLNCH